MLPWRGSLGINIRDSDDRGYILLELVVALPLLILLLSFCAMIALSSFRNYQRVIADNELKEECEIAVRRIVEDVQVSSKILNRPGGGYRLERIDVKTGRIGYVNYFINTINGQHKLVRGNARQPITGDHALAKVDITRFSIAEITGRQGLYYLQLDARSLTTGNTFTLRTKIYLRPQQH